MAKQPSFGNRQARNNKQLFVCCTVQCLSAACLMALSRIQFAFRPRAKKSVKYFKRLRHKQCQWHRQPVPPKNKKKCLALSREGAGNWSRQRLQINLINQKAKPASAIFAFVCRRCFFSAFFPLIFCYISFFVFLSLLLLLLCRRLDRPPDPPDAAS